MGHLLRDDAEPAHFDDWEREWVPAELLRPVGELNQPHGAGSLATHPSATKHRLGPAD